MMTAFKATFAAAAVLLAAGTAHAGVYAVTVSEGLSYGNGFSTVYGNPFTAAGTPSATFTYTGDLNFNDNLPQNANATGDLNSTFGFSTSNISNYAGSGTLAAANADYSSVAGFLASSGSASGYQYASYYTFDLGVVAAGTIFTITHDDGISLFQGATQIGSPSSGPTSAVTDTIDVTSTGDTILRYSRQNGTPSVLQVAVPEPASLALLGTGLAFLGLLMRRRSV